MIAGIRGRLLTASFVGDLFPSLAGLAPLPTELARQAAGWWERADAALGPASTVRAIADASVVPLLRMLDLEVAARAEIDGACVLQTRCGGHDGPAVVVIGWSEPLSHAWRGAVRGAIAAGTRWALCANGTALRVVDARRTWSRDHLEFDLALLSRDLECLSLLWQLLRGPAITAPVPLLDRAVALSVEHGEVVCRALGAGAIEALAVLTDAIRRPDPRGRSHQADRHRPAARAHDPADDARAFQQAVTVLYRLLFLLFAEARGLVPVWHPVYRARYSLETIVGDLLAHRPVRGLWQAAQAMARLAHHGCAAGELKVNAFNGRLFSAAETAGFERRAVSDAVMARAIAAVSTREPGRSRPRTRILYRDLDVEQLGAVYEQALEYEPAGADGPRWVRSRDRRKSSGTFYTPRAVTAFLVQRTLSPLVAGRRASEILQLRVIDPAMGSGAMLVAACRYLAAAAEEALVAEGVWHAGDVTPADRAALRREIALRCLYGIDANPMAVQLARLSLWLTTLSADRPLSFLDHHLVAGDSLVGARPEDVLRRPSRARPREGRDASLPLFEGEDLQPVLEHAFRERSLMALQPDDTAAIVEGKAHALAALTAHDAPLGRWSRLLDLWCAGWFWEEGAPPDRRTFRALSDEILRGRSELPPKAAAALLRQADGIAARRRFLHWPLAFPEVFADARGLPSAAAGFDAVIGNPPWDVVRGDSGAPAARAARRGEAKQLGSFVRESGVYRIESGAHVNRYQLFVERALQIARVGGRVGLVLPAGVASDTGSAGLRRHLFERAEVDSITGIDNRAAIFPIHRSVRFALLTCTTGRPTGRIACRFGLSRAEDLGADDAPAGLLLSRRLLARLSGDDDLGIPEMATGRDLRIVERIRSAHPWLSHPDGWRVRFGRELNATDDRACFQPRTDGTGASPIVEGKQIEPFRVLLQKCRLEVRPGARLPPSVGSGARLAYRDVASATNRLTLIAAIVPAGAVTTHTLFCLRTALEPDDQHVLCALMNSFVANYLIRMRVATHVTVALVSRLPVPLVRRGHPAYDRLLSLSRALAAPTEPVEERPEYAELQAIVARVYGLTGPEFEHVLSTFPLIADSVMYRCRKRFSSLERPR